MISVIPLDVWFFGSLVRREKLHIHISRQKDVCFTLIYGPFARKINSIFTAKGWVKDPVLFKPHSMNLKQHIISTDCFKSFPQFGFTWRKICRTTQESVRSQCMLIVISGISENLKNV